MSESKTFLLQLWQDARGPWVVVKDQVSGQLYQFESLEALTQFLSAPTKDPTPLQAQTPTGALTGLVKPDTERVG
ncbi:hypothetical protein [Meiothermus sp.]|uniref:hypothetical protein n=1 Tax=Meiothermus sp. TaxID=1955249 RepID=UPI00307EC169